MNDYFQDYHDDKIIKVFMKKYKNICYIKNDENLGTGHSREIGVSKSRGEYIGFLDSDDYVEPYVYKLMHKYAKSASADIVVANYKNVDDWNINIANNIKPNVIRTEIINEGSLFEF